MKSTLASSKDLIQLEICWKTITNNINVLENPDVLRRLFIKIRYIELKKRNNANYIVHMGT